MSGYILKPADQMQECSLDWQQGYLQSGEAIEGDLGWSITPVETTSDLAVVHQDIDGSRSRATLRGGEPGKVYMICARIRTDRGRALERGLVVRIAA